MALRNREWDLAVGAFDNAVAEDSTNAVHHFWLARATGELVRRANPFRAAMALPTIRGHITTALALDPAFVDARMFMIEMLLRSPVMMGGGIAAAAAHVDTLQRHSRYAAALAGTQVSFAEPDSATAERALTDLARSYPDSVAPYVVLLNVRFARSQFAQADSIGKVMRRSTRLMRVADYYQGRVAVATGRDLVGGEAALRRYIAQPRLPGSPSYAWAHTHRARILLSLGRVPEARAALTEALRLDPELAEAIDLLASLEPAP
jgi:predicted Zn-dependent protease